MTSEVPARADSDERAAALFDQAEARYLVGDVAGALGLMQRSYETSGRPELLFNLGELHRELRHCAEARRSYERYLLLVKSGARQVEAEKRAHELARQCPEAAAPAASTADGYWTPLRIAGWSTIGASLVFASTATYFAARAAQAQSDVDQQIHNSLPTGDYSPAAKQVEADGQHYATVARGLGAAAVGIAAIGVSFLVFAPANKDPATHGVSVRWNAESMTATYRGAF